MSAGYQSNLNPCPRIDQDTRLKTAYDAYNMMGPGVHKLHSVPRSGVTTSMLAESINRSEKFVAVMSTNAQAVKAVEDAERWAYTRDPNKHVIHIPANHQCRFNVEMCEKYPGLKSLPIMPIPETCVDKKGNKCEHYDACPVTEVLRSPSAHGYTLTYDKITAIIAASYERPDSTAAKILRKIIDATNIIFDDAHHLQNGKVERYTIINSNPKASKVKANRFDMTVTEDRYKYLHMALDAMKRIETDQGVKQLANEVNDLAGSDDNKTKKCSRKIPNPHKLDAEMDPGTFLMACWNEIIDLAIHVHNDTGLGIGMREVLALYPIIQIAVSDTIHLHGYRNRDEIKVDMVASSTLQQQMIRAFVTKRKKEESRVIFASSTFGSLDYTKFIRLNDTINDITFGRQGDPLDTNNSMVIITDNRKFDNYTKYEDLNSIIRDILNIIAAYDIENIEIFANSRHEALMIERRCHEMGYGLIEINYFKTTNKNIKNHDLETAYHVKNKRIAILIGSAEKPTSWFDVQYESTEDARKARIEVRDMDTYRAASMVKDPQGKEMSIIFCMGVPYREADGAATWGPGRHLEPRDKQDQRIKNLKTGLLDDQVPVQYEVVTDKQLSKPEIIKCSSIEEMVLTAMQHKPSKNRHWGLDDPYIFEEMLKWEYRQNHPEEEPDPDGTKALARRGILDLSITTKHAIEAINNVRAFCKEAKKNSVTVYSDIEFLELFCNRKDVFAVQQEDGSYLPEKYLWLSNDILLAHVQGDHTIGVYTLDVNNIVRWICWDIDAHFDPTKETEYELLAKQKKADQDAQRLYDYLCALGLHPIFEKSGSPHSYHIWLFIKPVEAKTAKAFGEDIKAALGLKCELFPKQTVLNTKKGYGNLVKLPFALHQKHKTRSTVLVGGEWVENIIKCTVHAVDISAYVPVPRAVSVDETKTWKNNKKGIRPIFKWLLTQDLTEREGHWARIACVREFYCNGMTDVGELAALFEAQYDYEFEKSVEKVCSIIKEDYGPWRWETMQDSFPSFVQAYRESHGN